MIKTIGAVLLVTGAAVFGISASKKLGTRARVLAAFSNALGLMSVEICERRTPTEELMRRLSESTPEPTGEFFKICAIERETKKDTPFEIVWQKALSSSSFLELKNADKEALLSLGSFIGRYSAEEQREAIAHTKRRIDALAADAEHERKRLGSVYAKLGIVCGIAVTIVFI